ncbi:hypothetical protein DY000_02034129 [Brassica cretica]|uniref:Uncharacterized protein n=1 Tax=Brassica cretica TaxID=69181 RepID=A0ABQ7DE71_BRACR|nr:hypothetical protein DY000_02034129 [Brassica cretica]
MVRCMAVNGKLSVEEECPSSSAVNGFDGGEKVKQGGTKGSRLSRRASADLNEGNYDKDEITLGGRYSRDLFNRHGDLRHIKKKKDQKPET